MKIQKEELSRAKAAAALAKSQKVAKESPVMDQAQRLRVGKVLAQFQAVLGRGEVEMKVLRRGDEEGPRIPLL